MCRTLSFVSTLLNQHCHSTHAVSHNVGGELDDWFLIFMSKNLLTTVFTVLLRHYVFLPQPSAIGIEILDRCNPSEAKGHTD